MSMQARVIRQTHNLFNLAKALSFMKQIKKCDLCGKSDFSLLYRNSDRMIRGNNAQFSVVKCRHCNLVFLNPQPSEKELQKYYPKKEYYSLKKNSVEDLKLYLYKIFQDSRFSIKKILFYPMKPFLRGIKIIPGGNILDIGCGDGKFLEIVRQRGMNCYGVDPFAENRNKNGIKIIRGNLKQAHFKSNFFDVITINHTFEHVSNPSETLKEIRRILKPGGILILATPNIESFASRIFKKYWFQLDTPRHLFLYSKKTLLRYAKKEGLECITKRYTSTPLQFLVSLQYQLNPENKPLSEFKRKILDNRLLFVLLLPLAYLVNLMHSGDQLEIYLRKKK